MMTKPGRRQGITLGWTSMKKQDVELSYFWYDSTNHQCWRTQENEWAGVCKVKVMGSPLPGLNVRHEEPSKYNV